MKLRVDQQLGVEGGIAQSNMHRRSRAFTSKLLHGPPRVRQDEQAIADELGQETR
jgi:hypothetical protein